MPGIGPANLRLTALEGENWDSFLNWSLSAFRSIRVNLSKLLSLLKDDPPVRGISPSINSEGISERKVDAIAGSLTPPQSLLSKAWNKNNLSLALVSPTMTYYGLFNLPGLILRHQ